MTDAVTTASAQAVAAMDGGAEDSRDQLVSAWAASTEPLTRCALAHRIADLSADPVDELAWDERALAEADAAGESCVALFYPSLYLNLAASHLRLGDGSAARTQLERAEACQSALGEDPYSAMIRGGIARMRAGLDAGHAG